jgi:hypothetical protein
MQKRSDSVVTAANAQQEPHVPWFSMLEMQFPHLSRQSNCVGMSYILVSSGLTSGWAEVEWSRVREVGALNMTDGSFALLDELKKSEGFQCVGFQCVGFQCVGFQFIG